MRCDKPIPSGRLKALPNTRVCVNCSEVECVVVDVILDNENNGLETETIIPNVVIETPKLKNNKKKINEHT